jgi:hypothetical protein
MSLWQAFPAPARPDRAMDRLYRKAPFATDSDRVLLLFERIQALTGDS